MGLAARVVGSSMMAAEIIDDGKKVVKKASMVKKFATEVFNKVADKAVQIHGGMDIWAIIPLNVFIVMQE